MKLEDRKYRPISVVHGGVFAVVLLVISGCAGPVVRAPVDERTYRPAVRPVSTNWYTVRRGDTLYSIAFSQGSDFRTIARLNNIPRPYTIYPGQRIRIKSSGTAAVRAKKKPSSKPAVSPDRKRVKSTPRKKPVTRKYSRIRWQWPVKGKLLRAFNPRAPRKKGIGIAGKFQQPVYAAGNGQVVYSGDGLIGYGNLIIIKHSEAYLSAYALNDVISVQEGQSVKRGQKIALMGKNENAQPMLHFEIRKNGKPVNPVRYLPR